MPLIDNIPPGSFCWIELATVDQNAAKQFYTALFGWSFVDGPMGPDEIYTMFKLQGRDVGAAFTLNQAMREQGVPPNWALYVSSASADDTVQAALDAGGRAIAGPFDVADYGRMAVLQDPTGAMVSVWEPRSHAGFGIAGEPGTLCWADLSTPDPETASAFYNAAFGWSFDLGQDGSGYLHINNGDTGIGGIPPAAMRSPGAPPHWMIYMLVADCDQSAAQAKELGARLYLEPMSIENVGRMAVVADPQGAVFALFQPAPRP
ncbi:MAG: VOC family protein [Bryobacteraceae bacterium]